MTNSAERLKQPQETSEPGPYKEVRAEQLTLVDAAGNEHATLRIAGGGAVLTMRDSQGRPRLRLRAGDDEATITICGEAGKGIFSDADGVERVAIGYDPDAQEPRVVINDGNEKECVSLSLHSGEDDNYSGVIHLTDPSDNSFTGIDSAGLFTSGDDGAPDELAAPSTGAKPAEAWTLSPEAPADTDDARSHTIIDDAAVRDLVDRIIPQDGDEEAKAFISLIHFVAYNDDRLARDIIALRVSNAAYQRTIAHDKVALEFFDAAQAEFPLRAE